MNNKSYCLNNKSLIPAIEEAERFIGFLNERFKLKLPKDFMINIIKSGKGKIGYFTPKGNDNAFKFNVGNETKSIHSITLNTLYLKDNNPYEVLTHELAHFINEVKGIKDCSSNQYHNKHFKEVAEMLLLRVEKTRRGYSQTDESEEFKKMLKEFKPNPRAFNIFQELVDDGNRQKSRLFLFTCENECFKIRSGIKELNVICGVCNTPFVMS